MKAISEQRNPYKGSPARSWVRLRLEAPDASIVELDLLADTGSPCAVIIGGQSMLRLKVADAPDVSTNFGLLQGGWLRVAMPELGLVCPVVGYGGEIRAFEVVAVETGESKILSDGRAAV